MIEFKRSMRDNGRMVKGAGAYWLDGFVCEWCGEDWADVGPIGDVPDQRQFVGIRLFPMASEAKVLCPRCAEELIEQVMSVLEQDVPMGPQPEDTETYCALSDDHYDHLVQSGDLWWDADNDRPMRGDREVTCNPTSYKRAKQAAKHANRRLWS